MRMMLLSSVLPDAFYHSLVIIVALSARFPSALSMHRSIALSGGTLYKVIDQL